MHASLLWGFPAGSIVKNLPDNAGDTEDLDSTPRSGRFRGGGNGKFHGKVHGQRSLAGYSPWSCKESDMTESLSTHTHTHTHTLTHIYTYS